MLMLLIAFFSLQSFAESPNPPRSGRFEARGTYSYFSSDANFNKDGTKEDLTNSGSFMNMRGDLKLSYDLRPDWRFSAGGSFSYVESDNGSYARDNSGLDEVYVEAQNWYELGPFDIVPEVHFAFPLWRVDTKSDSALIGEGAMKLRGGSWFFYPQGTIRPFAYVGFEYRDEGRAFLLPYQAGIKLKWTEFYLQGAFRGFESVVKDADTDNTAVRANYLQTVDGGSDHFYPINPRHNDVVLEAGTQFGSWGVFAGASLSVLGENYSDGWTAYGGLSFAPHFGRTHRRSEYSSPDMTPADSFKVRDEKYDQRLFEGDSSALPQITTAPPRNRVTPTPKPKAPPQLRKSPPVDVQVQLRKVKKKRAKKKIQNQLNDAEKSLENK